MTELQLLPCFKDGITSLSFAPDNSNRLLASSWDTTVRLLDTEQNKEAAVFRHPAAVLAASFGATAGVALSGGLDKTVKMHDLATERTSEVGTHSMPVSCISHSDKQGVAVSGGWDKMVNLWDIRSPEAKPVTSIAQPERVYTLQAYGTKVIVGHAGRHIHIYDLRNTAQPEVQSTSPLSHQTRCIRMSPDESAYAIGSIEGKVAVEYLDPARKHFSFRCHRTKAGQIFPVNAIAFHPVHGSFATGGGDGVVNVWDPKRKKKTMQTQPYGTSIAALDINPTGDKLAIAVSYTFEMGNVQAPQDRILIRTLRDQELSHDLQTAAAAAASHPQQQ